MKKSILYYLTHPSIVVAILLSKLSDRYAIEYRWKQCMSYPLNLDNPQTFTEKLNWLKLHDRNPLYHKLVDKYEVKQWVAERIGGEYVVKNYALYNSVDEIDFDKLPNNFVLKCTHNSGGMIICRDKSTLDIVKTKEMLLNRLNVRDYSNMNKEWVYKDVRPRIIAEELLEDNSFDELVNYKFWCFNGEPYIMYITVKTDDIWENFYDMDFQLLDISHGFRKYEGRIDKPVAFEQMKEIARKLSLGIPHVRVDLYQIKGQVKFSELTFYDWGGFRAIQPIEWDYRVGSWLDLDVANIK